MKTISFMYNNSFKGHLFFLPILIQCRRDCILAFARFLLNIVKLFVIGKSLMPGCRKHGNQELGSQAHMAFPGPRGPGRASWEPLMAWESLSPADY